MNDPRRQEDQCRNCRFFTDERVIYSSEEVTAAQCEEAGNYDALFGQFVVWGGFCQMQERVVDEYYSCERFEYRDEGTAV